LSFVWAKLATEPASREDVSNKAVTRREKLFILKTSRLSNRLGGKAFWGKIFPRIRIEGFCATVQTSAEAQVPA
jgi:hypothetical protein